MKCLHLFRTYEEAKAEFKRFVELADNNNVASSASYSNLLVDLNGSTHKFMSASDNLIVRLKGHSFDSVRIDNGIDLTEEQKVALAVATSKN